MCYLLPISDYSFYALFTWWRVIVLDAQSCPTLHDPMDCSPQGSSVHGIVQARTGVGSHVLLQGIFLSQKSNLGLPHCGQILYHLSHQGSPSTLRSQQKCHFLEDPWSPALGERSCVILLPELVPQPPSQLSLSHFVLADSTKAQASWAMCPHGPYVSLQS